MDTCAVEVGLLKKKPCGHPGVAKCANCEMALCNKHAVAQLSATKQRTGKFMCKECTVAAKEHAKSMAGVARSQEAKKLAVLEKTARVAAAAPPAPPKKPAAAPQAPAQAAPAEQPKESGALEFTPKDGSLSYTPKKE